MRLREAGPLALGATEHVESRQAEPPLTGWAGWEK